MPYYGSIQVQDRSGWVKTFRLEKSLVMVGSAPVNDVVLPAEHGDGVNPVHLQFLHPQPELINVRAVNLTGSVIPLVRANPSSALAIAANAYQDLEDGDGLQIGGFTLTLALRSSEGFSCAERTEHLGLKLEMPTPRLRAGKQVDGLLTVTNFGAQKRCQFEIDLEGLPADCYQIDPAPLLSPNGEEQLRVRFLHRGARPQAGPCPVSLHVTAPLAYPTEEVLLTFNLEVDPIYRIDVRVQTTPAEPAAQSEAVPQGQLPAETPAPTPALRLQADSAEGTRPDLPTAPAHPNGKVVSDALAQPAPADLPAPAAETTALPDAPADGGDRWTEALPAQVSIQPFDPAARRAARRPRLAPNQNIQVLRSSAEPAESEPVPSSPAFAEDGQG